MNILTFPNQKAALVYLRGTTDDIIPLDVDLPLSFLVRSGGTGPAPIAGDPPPAGGGSGTPIVMPTADPPDTDAGYPCTGRQFVWLGADVTADDTITAYGLAFGEWWIVEGWDTNNITAGKHGITLDLDRYYERVYVKAGTASNINFYMA